jgi:bacillolysin
MFILKNLSMKKLVLFSAFSFSIHFAIAQVNEFCKNPDTVLFSSVSTDGWVKFNSTNNMQFENIFESHKRSFRLPHNFSMRLNRKRNDGLGFTHYRFLQTYNGISIDGGYFLIHQKGNHITGNGKLFSPLKINEVKEIDEKSALQLALANINALKYRWQDPYFENRIKAKKQNPAATYYPVAEKKYIYDEATQTLQLCYQFNIYAVAAENSFSIYISASTGKVMRKLPLTITCNAGTFNSNWYGQKTVYSIFNSPFYELEDDCTPSVYQVNDATTTFNDVFTDAGNTWATDWKRSAATTSWGLRQTRDWYASVFGRNGHGNGGQDIDVYQGYTFSGNNPNNASFTYDPTGDDEIRIGIGNTASVLDDWNAIDITGHEFTHGVDQYEGSLDYEKESGALDESFADIFGEYIQFKVTGAADWYVGMDRRNVANNCVAPIRSMINPAQQGVSLGNCSGYNFNHPNTYQGQFWFSVNGPEGNDNWGVHTNSGVQNHMFYLLTVGGSGWNNGQTAYAPANTGYGWGVTGIGIESAIRIAYRVLTEYMASNSNYFSARTAWVHAAVDLYGECSNEATQTGKAWNAVGIGPPASISGNFCGTYGGTPYNYVKTGEVTVAQNCAVNILTTGNTVQVTSGTRIVIGPTPGFSVSSGSRFVAKINSDCIFAAY